MSNNLTSKTRISREELINLRTNILKKMALLDIKLPEFATLVGASYQALRRITYDTESSLPNITTLYPIADFFGVTVADLLKYPNMPQYVPIVKLYEVEDYLKSPSDYEDREKILLTEYVDKDAFAITINNKQYDVMLENTFIFKPTTKISMDNLLLIKYMQNLMLIHVLNIKDNNVNLINITDNKELEIPSTQITTLGIGVKLMVNNDLI
jgi:transcriptional regulator with XRE-family HTH domain